MTRPEDEVSPAAALSTFAALDELILGLYERDLDGLPATIRRACDRALDKRDPRLDT